MLLRVCWIAIPVLALMNVLDRVLDDRLPIATLNMVMGKFHMDFDLSIPAWFTVQLIFLSAAVTGGLAWRAWRRGGPDAWRYTLLAGVLLFLSADESAGLHELLGTAMRERLNLSGLLFFGWMIPVGLAAAGVGVCMIPLLKRLPAATRNTMILGGGVYILGAAGLEMLAGPFAEAGNGQGIEFFTLMTVEECLEMAGMLIYLQAASAFLLGQVEVPLREPDAAVAIA
ncbi:hypothetical membrane protein [Phycisphaera mikurensis NBRC 102666]|uniref:Hypothetical membrane protein n=1 Tax=Phycisphaera mikurensis (strain NBRC 102666 / KCTC 22515 / FYK2301M01) TaxID=1142394 RepID=I0IIE8_PHYMF|nr:hypothetical membrane protein [Phycisphaera mikurensis NBRC 102666]